MNRMIPEGSRLETSNQRLNSAGRLLEELLASGSLSNPNVFSPPTSLRKIYSEMNSGSASSGEMQGIEKMPHGHWGP